MKYKLLFITCALLMTGYSITDSHTYSVFATEEQSNDSMGMKMDMNMNTTSDHTLIGNNPHNAIPPITQVTTDKTINVKLLWIPQKILPRIPITFTIEFLDSKTGEHLKDVEYSLHLFMNGSGIGHSHSLKTANGIGKIVWPFSSSGTLTVIVEVSAVNGLTHSTDTAFNIMF